jgi:hypothetical protein
MSRLNAVFPYALTLSFCHFQQVYFMKIKFNIFHAFWGCFVLYYRYFVRFWYQVGVLMSVTLPSVPVDRAYPDIYGELQVS